MSNGGVLVRGPWRSWPGADALQRPAAAGGREASAGPDGATTAGELPERRAGHPPIRPGESKMMLGFIVRECAVALGHDPSPAELAGWANHQQDERGEPCCLFGRAISAEEARVILKHRGRPVTVRPSRLEAAAGARARRPGDEAETRSRETKPRDEEEV